MSEYTPTELRFMALKELNRDIPDKEYVKTIRDLAEKREKNTLLPCPFCGSSKAVERQRSTSAIICSSVKGGCGAGMGYCGSYENTIIAWNRRH